MSPLCYSPNQAYFTKPGHGKSCPGFPHLREYTVLFFFVVQKADIHFGVTADKNILLRKPDKVYTRRNIRFQILYASFPA